MTPEEKLTEIARLLTFASRAKSFLSMQTPESVLEGIKRVVND